MGKTMILSSLSAFAVLFSAGCEKIDNSIAKQDEKTPESSMSLSGIAEMFSEIPIDICQIDEVHDAVSSSEANGYDEEYMMNDLLSSPGRGVGDDPSVTKSASVYPVPIKNLIAKYLADRFGTKSEMDDSSSVMRYLDGLCSSGAQIYWPNSEKWDGKTIPIITFDPGDGSVTNEGYRINISSDGTRKIEKILVDEKTAEEKPVWVINRNDDSSYSSLEILRRNDPDWGTGGGITVNPALASADGTLKTLVLKSFKMKRNYDSWFAGASEFFIKCGAVEDFTASTEAELRLYNPMVTDFMLVVKRKQKGLEIPLDVVLVSDWTDQLENCAFMITEDDGGTRTVWNCSAVVKIKSKSYGFDISIPFNKRDDIVWRGSLSGRYLKKYNEVSGHFGDVDLKFGII